MVKNYAVVFLVVGIMLMSGCVGQSTAQTKAAAVGAVGGTQGLAISFLPSQPPEQVYENSLFQIAVKVENKGEADVSSAKVYLTGIDKASFELKPKPGTAVSEIQPISKLLKGTKRIGDSVVPGV